MPGYGILKLCERLHLSEEFGYTVPIILPSLGSLYVVQTYTQCNRKITDLVNQLIQLTPEEHRVLTLFMINI